ncbi:hypothetical protein BGLA2_1940011 [Burkholderia gladioli]|nr:hypothetical protein BGLA2_1940011 [Burkholderia gladioli]
MSKTKERAPGEIPRLRCILLNRRVSMRAQRFCLILASQGRTILMNIALDRFRHALMKTIHQSLCDDWRSSRSPLRHRRCEGIGRLDRSDIECPRSRTCACS